MMTIITPLGGSALYEMSAEFSYPKILNEIDKKTLFEYSQEIVAGLPTDTRRIFLIPGQKDKALQLSSMIAIVSNGQGKVIHLQGDTGGAVCSCLLAVDDIDPDDEVIIISGDQYISGDIHNILDYFRQKQADAGVLTFTSLHPKWAFIRKQADGRIIEVAEKRAISREAIAGFYYFRKGEFFINAARRSIIKGAMVNGQYYLSGCLNEMILQNMKITGWSLQEGSYHNFYDYHAIKEFSSFRKPGKARLPAGFCYSDIFTVKEIIDPEMVFDSRVILQKKDLQLSGITAVTEYLTRLLCSAEQFREEGQLSGRESHQVIILYTLYCQGNVRRLLDTITVSEKGKIIYISQSEVT